MRFSWQTRAILHLPIKADSSCLVAAFVGNDPVRELYRNQKALIKSPRPFWNAVFQELIGEPGVPSKVFAKLCHGCEGSDQTCKHVISGERYCRECADSDRFAFLTSKQARIKYKLTNRELIDIEHTSVRAQNYYYDVVWKRDAVLLAITVHGSLKALRRKFKAERQAARLAQQLREERKRKRMEDSDCARDKRQRLVDNRFSRFDASVIPIEVEEYVEYGPRACGWKITELVRMAKLMERGGD